MKTRGNLPLGLTVPADKAMASVKAHRTLQAAQETVHLDVKVFHLTQ
jgi:hypothetical protein